MKEQKLSEIKRIVCTTLVIKDISPQEDLFEAGYLDSLAIVNLIMALEEEFHIKLSLETLDLDEFRSIESIYRLISPMVKMTA